MTTDTQLDKIQGFLQWEVIDYYDIVKFAPTESVKSFVRNNIDIQQDLLCDKKLFADWCNINKQELNSHLPEYLQTQELFWYLQKNHLINKDYAVPNDWEIDKFTEFKTLFENELKTAVGQIYENRISTIVEKFMSDTENLRFDKDLLDKEYAETTNKYYDNYKLKEIYKKGEIENEKYCEEYQHELIYWKLRVEANQRIEETRGYLLQFLKPQKQEKWSWLKLHLKFWGVEIDIKEVLKIFYKKIQKKQ